MTTIKKPFRSNLRKTIELVIEEEKVEACAVHATNLLGQIAALYKYHEDLRSYGKLITRPG